MTVLTLHEIISKELPNIVRDFFKTNFKEDEMADRLGELATVAMSFRPYQLNETAVSTIWTEVRKNDSLIDIVFTIQSLLNILLVSNNQSMTALKLLVAESFTLDGPPADDKFEKTNIDDSLYSRMASTETLTALLNSNTWLLTLILISVMPASAYDFITPKRRGGGSLA